MATLTMESAPLFDQVLRQQRPALLRMARRKSRTPEDAEDAVQDALLSAYTHLGQFEGRAQMASWLTRIVINAALTRLRHCHAHPAASLDESTAAGMQFSDSAPNPEQLCAERERRDVLAGGLEQLPAPLRAAVQLRQIEGLSTREAARTLGIAEGTLKSHLFRARARLTEAVEAKTSRRAARGTQAAARV